MLLRSGRAAALVLAFAAMLAGCAAGPFRRTHARLPPPASESRAGAPDQGRAGPAIAPARGPAASGPDEVARAVAAASALVGRRDIVVDGVDYGKDCIALVRAAFDRAGRPLPASARDAVGLHDLALRRGALRSGRRPSTGDVVFLSDRPGGPPEHVGIVARADPDGTALVLHRAARGVARLRLNLSYPEKPTDPTTGKLINDTLLVASKPVPAGSLVVGLADLLRVPQS